MFDFRFCIHNLLCQRLFGTFQLTVAVKIFLRIFSRCHRRIQRNRNFFIRIIIKSLKRFAAVLQPITICIDQFSINFIFLLFGSIFHLFLLKNKLLAVSFKSSLYDSSKIRRFLTDSCQDFLRCIVSFQHFRNRFKCLTVIFRTILGEWENSIFYRFIIPVNNARSKIFLLHLFNQSMERIIKMCCFIFVKGLCRITSVNGSAIADFFRNQRTDSSQCCIDCLCNVTRLFTYRFFKSFFCNRQRILFFLCLRKKIISSRKNFPDRTHMGRNMPDTVKDHPVLITEDDVAVFSHQFNNQIFFTWIAQFV